MKIAACLIVRNAETTIEQCLASVRPFVDYVCVYDTGSTDGTLAKLAGLPEGDEEGPLAPVLVEEGEWPDDFSEARTRSFAMCPDDAEWILWLDDDDEVQGAHNLRYLAATADPQVDGFVVQYDYHRDENGHCDCVLWRERLLRKSAGYRWVNVVHEVLIPPDGKSPALVQVPPEMVRYVHHRELVPEDRDKPGRNLELLAKHVAKLAEEGKTPEPRTLAYLGTEHMSAGEFATAASYLQQYVEHPESAWSDERAQVHHKLAGCLRMLGNPQAAVHVEMTATEERDDWAENCIGLAQSFVSLGRWDRAERWARRCLELGMPRSPLILNPIEFTLLPWLIIAEACAHQGRNAEARDACQKALAAAPGNQIAQAQTQTIERLISENELVQAISLLREVLVRHDENEKAHRLLENVPYLVAERPEIVKQRADQRLMVRHLTHPEEYRRWYADEPKESTVDDEWVQDIGDHIPRAKRLLELCQQFEEEHGRKPRVLDLGANDMWIGCYLWLNGEYVVDGVELNTQSYEKGLRRMAKFGAPGEYRQGDLHRARFLLGDTVYGGNGNAVTTADHAYDIVALFEVLEHVPDVEETFRVMEQLCTEDGLICITTPNGAYERGNIGAWAKVERKGHLRAIPIHDLLEQLGSRGEIVMGELQHDDRVSFVAYSPKPRKGTVVFYAGGGWEPWSPRSINDGGLGGSETALVHVSLGLSAAGYHVKVYSGAEPGLVGNVLFRPFGAWDPTEECDLLVVSRQPHVFDNPLGAKWTALWCHDHSYPGLLTEERAGKIGEIIVLSEWQRERFARLYPFAEDKLTVIRNGIAFEAMGERKWWDDKRPFDKRKPRCVYSSSADRGLDVMLDVWPRIRKKVPDAELHVFYGFDVFDRVAIGNPALHAYKAAILGKVSELGGEEGGIFLRGRVGQKQLAEEMMDARVLAYPTAFLETSCITAMEARAAGLPIVTSELGALPETVGSHGQLIPWVRTDDGPAEEEQHNQTEEYKSLFVSKVVKLLTDERHWTRWHERALRGTPELAWEHRIPEWEAVAGEAEPVEKREAVAA